MTERIAPGKLVEFTYTITDEDGTLVEQVDFPLNYIHGHDSGLHDRIEQALAGHVTGDAVRVTLAPEEGFGPRDPTLLYSDAIENVPEEFRHLGAEARFRNEHGEERTFRVVSIQDGRITLDGNHPLAGKRVTFTLHILQVRDATPQELSGQVPTGQAAGPMTTPPTLN